MTDRHGTKQPTTVTSDGRSLAPLPDGVAIRELRTIADHRGWVMEMFNPGWGWHPEPLVHAYAFTVRPGVIKGWGRHERTEDRYCVMFGEAMLVLFDARESSPTRGLVAEVPLTEHHRCLINIPPQIWHAIANVGVSDFCAVNFKTKPFDHADPDKYTLPLDSPEIPYSFATMQRH